ncbi:MAG: hypothetical protein LBU14_02280 [Candidatus Peribacteria bacterium]|nr:hypothetical protein [Candidatus Peribacteria bacterium]
MIPSVEWYHVLHVIASLAFDNIIVVPSASSVNVAVNVLVQLVILNAFDVFVCGIPYTSIKLVNVNVFSLYVAFVTV